jgi:hypothetical protein
MAGSKDHTDISPDNILKPDVESLTADEQQQYEDYMRQPSSEGEILITIHGGSSPESCQTWRDRRRISFIFASSPKRK